MRMHRLDRNRNAAERVILRERVFRHESSNLNTATAHSYRLTSASGCANRIESRSVGLEDVCEDGGTPRLPIRVRGVIAHADDFESMDDKGLHNL
jgi:hypothetical protein